MFRKRTDEVDPRTLMLPLSPARPGFAGYTEMDRYRDYRAVFFTGDATDLQRERVLYQIMALAGVAQPIDDGPSPDPRRAYRALGRRDVGLDIMKILTIEPRTGVFTTNERRDT